MRLWSPHTMGCSIGDRARSLPGPNSAAVRDGVRRPRTVFTRAARRRHAAHPAEASVAPPTLRPVPTSPPSWTAKPDSGGMDRIVGLYEQEARARVDRLISTAGG